MNSKETQTILPDRNEIVDSLLGAARDEDYIRSLDIRDDQPLAMEACNTVVSDTNLEKTMKFFKVLEKHTTNNIPFRDTLLRRRCIAEDLKVFSLR